MPAVPQRFCTAGTALLASMRPLNSIVRPQHPVIACFQMSYEFIVFDPSRLPGDKRALVESLQHAGSSFRFPDASECTDELKGYFEELRSYLPWIEDGADGDQSCDYSFSTSAIACTVTNDSRFAVDTALALCWRLKIGFYDIGSADVFYPAEIWDVITSRAKARRPWWKIWRP
jgi:hypothetical protein